jgi:Rrf2 family transcriptional regulator, cysteine metabolism repressor
VNISRRCEYGCRAVVELAYRAAAAQPVTVEHIAERRHIPEKFLIHILLQLKRAGIVRSVRGARGGYLLAREPGDISMFDIVSAIDGPILTPLPVKDSGSSDMAPVWREVARGISGILQETTVKDILDRADKSNMYYI